MTDITVPPTLKLHAPPPLSVRRNFAWSLAGNLLYALSQYGVLIVLAKLCSAAQVGLYVLGVAITSPLFLFAGMQLRRLQATDTREEFQFGHYLSLQVVACAVALAVSGATGVLAGHRETALAVICWVAVSKALETLSNTFYGLFQQHERLDVISKSMVWQGVLTAAGLCGGVILTNDIGVAAMASALARGAAILLYDVPSVLWLMGESAGDAANSRWQRTRQALGRCRLLWDWRPLKQLAMMGLPLGVTSLLISLNTNLPRLFVEGHCGAAELGIFGMLCTPLAVMHTLTRALESSASARLAKLFAAGDGRGFRKFFAQLTATHVAVGLVGVLVAEWFGKELLTILFRAEYAEHADVFVTIMWATLFAASSGVMLSALIAARFIQIQLPLIAMTSLASLAACAWWVPTLGMQGAALALLVSKLPYLAIGLYLLLRAKPAIPTTTAVETDDTPLQPLKRAA